MRIGTYKNNDDIYFIVYDTDNLIFTRLDVYTSRGAIDILNTTAAVASIIKRRDIFYYNDYSLANSILNVISAADVLPQTNAEINGTNIKITKSKGNDFRIVEMDLKTNAIITDTIKIGEVIIEFDECNSNKLDKDPINFSFYENINISKSLVDTNTYYSYDILKLKYPDIATIEKRDYRIIKSEEEMYEALDTIRNSNEGFVGVDTETTGLNVDHMGNDYMVGVILSPKENLSYYFPFRMKKFQYNLSEWHIRTLFEFIRDLPQEVLVLAHNGIMEIKSFYKELAEILRVDRDSYVLSVLVNPTFGKGVHHDLKNEAELCDNIKFLELTEIFKNKKDIDFSVLPEDITRVYACPDGDNTIKVYKRLLQYLPYDEQAIFMLESKEIRVKALNEYYGLRCKLDGLKARYDEVTAQCKTLENAYYNSIGDFRSITSPIALRDNIYGKLNAPVLLRTKTSKQPAVSKNAIAAILKDGKGKGEVCDDFKFNNKVLIEAKDLNNKYKPLVFLQKFNVLTKEQRSLKRLIDTQQNERIRFYINAVGASSGRQTSDAHQFSDEMKKVIIADSKQHNFFSCDYKQIEYRILLSVAGEEELIELANNPDMDLHRLFASRINSIPVYLISAEARKRAKGVNFGIVYGMTEYGLAENLYGVNYTKENVTEAINVRTAFFNALPQIKKFINNLHKSILEKGLVKTAFGRYRYDTEILDPDLPGYMKESIVRHLANTAIQGYGADLLKLVENKIFDWIHEKGWDKLVDCDGEMLPMVRMMLPIHDEILLSAHKSIPIEEILLMFRSCFEIDVKGACKYYAAPALVENWYDGKKDAYEIPIKYRDELLKQYQETHVSQINSDNWLTLLNSYRDKELKDWFDGLKAESKSFDDLVSKVNDPVLTHTLISLALKKDESKGLTQQECIRLATYKYLNNKVDSDDTITIDDVDDSLYSFDHEVVDGEEYDELDEEVVHNVIEASVQQERPSTKIHYMQDVAFIDITQKAEPDIIMDKIREHAHGNAYKVIVLIGSKKYECGYINYGDLDNLLKEI